MRLLGPGFVAAFPQAILNVHPSLLPAFPGLDAQRQALAHGVKVAGCTVHFVNEELDAGPIVLQAAVPVLPHDTVDSLAARILTEEHRIYPRAIGIVLAGVAVHRTRARTEIALVAHGADSRSTDEGQDHREGQADGAQSRDRHASTLA